MVQLRKLKLENRLVLVGAFLGLLAMLMPMYYCMYNGEELRYADGSLDFPNRYNYNLVFMPDFYPFTILLHLLFIVLIIGSVMNNFVTSKFMKLCPLIFSIILILLLFLDDYVAINTYRDGSRIILDYSAGFYFLLTSIGCLFIGGLMINLQDIFKTVKLQFQKLDKTSIPKVSDSKNFNDNLIIPESCPHCKSPNSKKIRICEWCGDQII
jgi:hypothetical protein